MTEPNPAKLHPTCANDHDGVRVRHWTIANTQRLSASCIVWMAIIKACNALSENIVCIQDLYWHKLNDHQKSRREAYHLEKQLNQQLDNALLVYSDFLQRIDSQVDEIAALNVQVCIGVLTYQPIFLPHSVVHICMLFFCKGQKFHQFGNQSSGENHCILTMHCTAAVWAAFQDDEPPCYFFDAHFVFISASPGHKLIFQTKHCMP